MSSENDTFLSDDGDLEQPNSPIIMALFAILTLIVSMVVPHFVVEVVFRPRIETADIGVVNAVLSELSLCIIPIIHLNAIKGSRACEFFEVKGIRNGSAAYWLILASVMASVALLQPRHCTNGKNGRRDWTDIAVRVTVHSALPAVCEELVYRGWLFGELAESVSKKSAAVTAAVLFTLSHINAGITSSVMLFVFSIMWTYSNSVCRSLIPSIIGHFAHNVLVTTAVGTVPGLCEIPIAMSCVLWVTAMLIFFWMAECVDIPEDAPYAIEHPV